MSLLYRIFGDPNEKVLADMRPLVEDINALEGEIGRLGPEAIRDRSIDLKRRVANGTSLDEILPEAFALCREAAKRTLGQRHYDVQLMGGIVLHNGQIAEMRTGEGKTLTATLAVYLNALSGKGVHVVTVNDYLSRRDAAWMGQVYHALGLSVACVNHQTAYAYDPDWKMPEDTVELTMEDLAEASEKEEGGAVDRKRDATGSFQVEMDYLRPVGRKDAYLADITYGTNNEYGFDYLRDNMAVRPDQKVQRPLHYAIVDEVDSILIDEARTPLIISAPAEEAAADTYYRFAVMVKPLQEDVDFNRDEKMKAASFTEEGQNRISRKLGFDPWADNDTRTIFHLEAALRAGKMYEIDRDYVVKDGEVIIVDEFTGRLMNGRRYSEGLHQAIEAKEGVAIQRESRTLATVTFQNYFRMYEKLAGMTGTAATEAEEFSKIYSLEVTVLPTNQPTCREDLPDRIYKNERGKFAAVVEEIRARHEKGQPVLVGTASIEKNEILGKLLEREGIPHELLNAKNHEREARIIAQAGRAGAVTIATNMAGRGVDIILGGNPPDSAAAERVRGLGGLFVIGTERHESRRIDNQLRGRAGRQGDPGSTRFFISLEDNLMRIFASDSMRAMMDRLGLPDDLPIENRIVNRSIESAQKKVEGHHFDVRKHLLEYDDVLNRHREVFYRKRDDMLGLPPDDSAGMRRHALELVESEIERVVLFHTSAEDEKSWDLKEIYEVIDTIFPMSAEEREKLTEISREVGSKREDAEARTMIIEFLMSVAGAEYDKLESRVSTALSSIGGGTAHFPDIVRGMILRAMDMLWVEHLDAMDHMRTGVGLQGYGQRDPLVEYKKESFRMFNEFMAMIEKQVVYSLFKMSVVAQRPQTVQPAKSLLDQSGLKMSGAQKSTDGGAAESGAGAAGDKVGRNDPCPCGSGLKYKKCHGK
ncbi:preprotein translocase subunit SecA [Candidatus Uhrbacteria bacterium CG_4_10_14_0_8_um_filter_58_22]|uniref:Protein translocase subunit SecA n=1 Tax=Candidatus Uhrbacteria bacterium CG_4_10_14_0_8_um_filter_58_22 TaxID=1975029 RepID=A0A2M7QBZ2_9BACT|nr:MAG: preprotein translocase subunit SecA [Parcubacteria group bacterium CG1_02_58_44]PIY63303.1 MAG: preprotein translocase subunit SecA [Candidatus Uhrbacteria bacterium CG_4_10_14_0_8_um_filter_58_22]